MNTTLRASFTLYFTDVLFIHIFAFYLATYGIWSEFSFQNAFLLWWVWNSVREGDGFVTRQPLNQHQGSGQLPAWAPHRFELVT